MHKPDPWFQCIDCGMDTIKEFYMVLDSIWKKAVPHKHRRKMLCIGCLEKRLGRTLTKKDFIDYPVNEVNNFKTLRLIRRLTHE